MATYPVNPPILISVTATFPKVEHLRSAYKHVQITELKNTKTVEIVQVKNCYPSKEGNTYVYHYHVMDSNGFLYHITLHTTPCVHFKLQSYAD